MDPSERRRQLLMAAKTVFAEKGYHASGVADVVATANVARGTFYLYFSSKRDIFSALVDYLFQNLMEQLHAIPLDEPEKILSGIIDNLGVMESFFTEDVEHANIIFREAIFLDEASARRVDEMRQALVEWLCQLVSQWQEAGILRPLDPQVLANAFLGAVRTLFEQRTVRGNLTQSNEHIVETLLDLFLFGMVDPEHFQLAADHLLEIGAED